MGGRMFADRVSATEANNETLKQYIKRAYHSSHDRHGQKDIRIRPAQCSLSRMYPSHRVWRHQLFQKTNHLDCVFWS
jgi:hypothetical protein